MVGARSGGADAATQNADTAAFTAVVGPAAAGGSSGGPSGATTIDTTAIVANRKAYLLSLVPDLTLDEVWMLQKRLASLDLRTDIFARLPPELQFMVADCLGPADLGCCLHVSPVWRGSFLHESLRKDLARRCFPSLLEYAEAVREQAARPPSDDNADGNVDSDDNADGNVDSDGNADDGDRIIDQIFSETARKYALRALGRFRYVFRHCRNPPLSVTEGLSGEAGSALSWLCQERPPSKRRQIQQQQQQQQQQRQQQEQQSGQYAWPPLPPPPPPELPANWEPAVYDADSEEDDSLILSFAGHEYAYGRLAWQCIRQNGTWFLVDDLRNGRRIPFQVPNSIMRGETYLLSAFGDELLVASTGIRMLAWNFITGEHQAKQLPAQVDVVATLGQRICILSLGDIYFWRLGDKTQQGKIQQVDMAGLEDKHRQADLDGRLPSFFLLDPINEDIFYLGNFELDTDATGRNGALCFYVHKFEGLRYIETFSHRLPFENFSFPTCLIEATVRRDARGLYSLASWRVSSGAPGWSSTQVEGIGSLAFNIYTKSFSQSFFRLPPLAPSFGREHLQVIRMHIWNDQMITLVDRFRDAPSGKVRRAKPLLLAFDDENGEVARCSSAQRFSTVPLYTSRPLQDGEDAEDEEDVDASGASGTPGIDIEGLTLTTSSTTHIEPECRRKVRIDELGPDTPGHWQQDDDDWEQNRCLLRFALDLDTAPSRAEPLRPAHIGPYYVQGDDDFLVFRHANEYTVWSFRGDVLQNSLSGAS